MRHAPSAPPEPGLERFPIAARDRWLEFLCFEHATLPAPADFRRAGEEFVVERRPVSARRIADGRIPTVHGPALVLQAAAFLSALQAVGFWACAADLREAAWDAEEGVARLWMTRTPAGVVDRGTAPVPSAVLADFLVLVFGRAGRVRDPAARMLEDALKSPEAPWRRAEFWVASAYRSFAALAAPSAAPARMRTVGSAGVLFKTAAERALIEKGRAILGGRSARLFFPADAPFTPGAVIAPQGFAGASAAARALRESHAAGSGGRRGVWICVGMDRWDAVSRAAVSTAALVLGGEVDVVRVPDTLAPAAPADELRREIIVPCGTVRASLRFLEKLADLSKARPGGARGAALSMVADERWAAYVADATGDGLLAPPTAGHAALGRPGLPSSVSRFESELFEAVTALAGVCAAPDSAEVAAFFPRRKTPVILGRLAARGLLVSDGGRSWRPASAMGEEMAPDRRAHLLRRWADVATHPECRIERLLAAGDPVAALAAAREWSRACPELSPGRWFELSARLAAAVPAGRPPWLDLLEAERELAGGRPGDAAACLSRVLASGEAGGREGREARLRLAEVTAMCGRPAQAAREAEAWRAASPDAPAPQTVRALLLEAAGASRDGNLEGALSRLDEAERMPGVPPALSIEIALARAAALSRAGRFSEEAAVYERCRSLLRDAGSEETLVARFLAREALGLADRRKFDAAAARLEEALALLRDDPVERARISIDLASTLYHAGRPARSAALLEEAAALAVGAGREDLARIARGNLVEAAIESCDWSAASAGIELLVSGAERDGDSTWTLVALHHRARLALRLGRVAEAERDNQDARAIAERIGDRLEVGELWLEDGDRAALAGDLEGARRSYARAADDPPDRCDTDSRARERLAELETFEAGAGEGLAGAAAGRVGRGEYAGAEAVARWAALFPGAVAESLRSAAADLLRARGAAALAESVFPGGRFPPAAGGDDLRRLRETVAVALAGDCPPGGPLPLGISGLSLSLRGEEILRLGRPASASATPSAAVLRAGSEEYALFLWPAVSSGICEAVSLVVETLLFRPPASPPPTEFSDGWRRFGVVAADIAMEEPYRRLTRFAPRPMTVLVLGESGSGKEAVARAVHALSPRAGGPFVAVNVSAIPAALVESELFGHARGAFTGAERDRAGLLEEAGRGTIFFDEIGDLAPSLQSKLLRALQDREIRRVGENRSRRIDVRVVSATSRDLSREVEAGRFREDLYYRLHVAVIRLPPLRERGRDAILLARHFLAQCAKESGRGELDLAPDAAAAVLAHRWPGNVRELQSAIAQAAALADGRRIPADLLPADVERSTRAAQPAGGYRARVNAHRRDLIMEALDRAGGNRSRAARDLRLSRQALLYLIRELKVGARPA